MNVNESAVLQGILQAAGRHPNSKVSRLINEFQQDRSKTTLVLLLEEVAQSAEYAVDFDINLEYYMNKFIDVISRNEAAFNECGRILDAVTRIWGRRVEDVYESMLHQSRSLVTCLQQAEEAAAEKAKQNAANQEKENVSKQKRRKRATALDPYEIKMEIKQFRQISAEKLNVMPPVLANPIITPAYFAEDHLNPALWRTSYIIDPDNPDNKDSKRNYKVFAYHIEHRYNTPVNDYNFRWHFAIKDFINEEDMDVDMEFMDSIAEDAETQQQGEQQKWTPQKYLQKSLTLENKAFERQLTPNARKRPAETLEYNVEKLPRISLEDCSEEALGVASNASKSNLVSTFSQDSGIGETMLSSSQLSSDSTQENSITETLQGTELTPNKSSLVGSLQNDSGNESMETSGEMTVSTMNGESTRVSLNANGSGINQTLNATQLEFNQTNVFESTNVGESDVDAMGNSADLGFADATTQATTGNALAANVVLANGKVADKLPQSDDEGIVLSDLEETDRQSPATNVKQENAEGQETSTEAIEGDEAVVEEIYNLNHPLKMNILQIKEKVLKHRVLFKLPLEYNFIANQKLQNGQQKTQKKEEPKKFIVKDVREIALKRYNAMGISNSLFADLMGGSRMSFEYDETSCSSVDYEMDLLGFSENMYVFSDDDRPPFWEELLANLPWDPDRLSVMSSQDFESFPADNIKTDVDVPTSKQQEASITTANAETSAQVEDALTNADEEAKGETQTIPGDAQSTKEGSFKADTQPMEIETPNEERENSTMETSDYTKTIKMLDDSSQDSASEEKSDTVNTCMQTETDLKIRNWHRMIGPSLAAAHARQHFSVYDIGSTIIRKLSTGSNTLADLVEGDDPTYLSRTFLAMLMLTNQNNLKLNADERNYNEPLSLSDLKVQLISTKRHEVTFEDDIGSAENNTTIKPPTAAAAPSSSSSSSLSPPGAKKTKLSMASKFQQEVNFNAVIHTLKPIPKAPYCDENDSGISSMGSQISSVR